VSNINQNRWDQLVRRVAGLIGPGSKVNNTIGDLFPMLDVENLPGELYLLSGTRLGTGGVLQQGSAGEVPRIQLFNPADSGLICTLTTFVVSGLSTQNFRYVYRNVAESTNDLGVQTRDTRLGIGNRPTCQVRSASEAAVLAGTGEWRQPASSVFKFTEPNGIAVLAPGTGFTITAVTVATTIQVSFWWRERTAEASELNF